MSSDPYGLKLAEAQFESSERLENCAADPACPEQDDALFWIAAFELSNLNVYELDLSPADLNEVLRADKTFDELFFQNDPTSIETDYDTESTAFRNAYATMKASAELGSVYALNELGLLHMQKNALRNLGLAEEYLRKAAASEDANADYNLSRLLFLSNPDACEEALSLA